MYGILSFKIFIYMSSYPWESFYIRELVISSISLVDTDFNLMEGNDWMNALNK